MTAPPQVIRRGDGSFVVLNVDIDQLSHTQRIGVAVLVWDQARELMEVSGEYKPRDKSKVGTGGIGTSQDIDRAIAQAMGLSGSSLLTVRPRLQRRPDVLERVLAGEFRFGHDIQRELGKRIRVKLSEGAPSHAKRGSHFYGKGDRFEDAITPLDRYLEAWKRRGFLFAHVNPKEAKRRLATIDVVMENLAKAKEDLSKRSHAATLRVPR